MERERDEILTAVVIRSSDVGGLSLFLPENTDTDGLEKVYRDEVMFICGEGTRHNIICRIKSPSKKKIAEKKIRIQEEFFIEVIKRKKGEKTPTQIALTTFGHNVKDRKQKWNALMLIMENLQNEYLDDSSEKSWKTYDDCVNAVPSAGGMTTLICNQKSPGETKPPLPDAPENLLNCICLPGKLIESHLINALNYAYWQFRQPSFCYTNQRDSPGVVEDYVKSGFKANEKRLSKFNLKRLNAVGKKNGWPATLATAKETLGFSRESGNLLIDFQDVRKK